MALTQSQLAALKAAIDAKAEWAAYPLNSDGYLDLSKELNKPSDPPVSVWRTEAPTADILDAVDQSKYTPNDGVLDSNTDTASLMRLNARALYAQTKLMVLHSFVLGRQTLNASLIKIRSSLRDAVISVPTGSAGASTAPGGSSGVDVLTKCTRVAKAGEAILVAASQGSDTTGTVTARVMTFEGNLSAADVEAARNLP